MSMAMKQSVARRPVMAGRRTVNVVARAASKSKTAAPPKGSTYVCLDCGYVYPGSLAAFDKLDGKKYSCPVCKSPKRRFKLLAPGDTVDASDGLVTIAAGTAVFIGLLYYALSASGKI